MDVDTENLVGKRVLPETRDISEVKVDKAELYFGANTGGITELRKSIETTIGEGIYLTSQIEAAKGYAKQRARGEIENERVYKVEIENLKFADLRELSDVEKFALQLKNRLLTELQREDLRYHQTMAINQTLETIGRNTFKGLKDITWNHQRIVTELLMSKGYDGLVALEGGEGDIGKHDSWLVFDPSKTKVVKEVKQ